MGTKFNYQPGKYSFLVVCILTLFACTKPETDKPPAPEPPLNAADVPVRISGKAVHSTIIGHYGSIQYELYGIRWSWLGADGNATQIPAEQDNYFRIESDNLNEDATILKLNESTSSVDFPVSYPILVQKDRIHYIRKLLLPDDRSAVLSKTTAEFEMGTTIAGIHVITDANCWISEGNPWDGDIEMTLLLWNNMTPHLIDFQPGDMRGVNKDGQMVYLHPYLMTGVKAASRNMYIKGTVSPGKKIRLQVPIPQRFLGTVTNFVNMWMYDQHKGLWREAGYAERNGNYYDVAMPQTGIAAVASATPLVYLHARLINKQGDPLIHTQAVITPQDETAWPVSVFTDNKGEFATYVPAGLSFTLRVQDVCAGSYGNIVMGPLTANTWITETLPFNRGPVTVLEGDVMDCDHLPMKAGNIIVRYRDLEVSAPVKNGRYSVSFINCGSDPVSYRFYDSSARSVNSKIRSISPVPGTVNRLPLDTACQQNIRYLKGDITFTVDGATYTLNGDEDLIYLQQETDYYSHMPTTYMYAVSPKINKELGFSFNSFTAGTYSFYTLIAATPANPGYIMAWGYYSRGTIIVNEISLKNKVLKGSFNSLISRNADDDGFRNPVTITGTFDLK